MGFSLNSMRSWLQATAQSPGGASALTDSSRVSTATGVWPFLYIGVALLALLQAWINIGLIGRGVEFIVSNITVDDTYYYLQTAWNHATLGFPTFDGRHATNGVQALWYFCVLVMAFFAGSKENLLHLALYTSIALTALCYVPITIIGRAIGRTSALILLTFSWLFLNVQYRIFLTGMENALHALIIWTILAVSMYIVKNVRLREMRRSVMIALAILLSLNVWCRIDAALLSLAIYGYVGWLLLRHSGRREAVKFLAMTAFVGGVFAALLLVTYYLMAGTPLPVSGQIKNASFHLDPTIFFQNVWRGLRFTVPYLANVSGDSLRRSAVTLFVLIALVAGSTVARHRFASPELTRPALASYRAAYGPYAGLFGVLVVSSVIQMLYLAGLGQFTLYGLWYITAYLIICLLGFVMLSDWVWLNIQSVLYTIHHSISTRFAVSVAGVILLALSMALIEPHPHHWVSQDRPQRTHHILRYQIARRLSAQLPEDAIVAAWNAGELGYFMERPVINLDGLVNSYTYYQEVLSGDVSLSDYLEREGVTHVLDSDMYMPDVLPEGWVWVQEWPVEEGKAEQLILFATSLDVAEQ